MNRLDRALGILLLLRGGAIVSAAELARRFEVAPRTIYRDIEALGAVGVPVYAEMGRRGGFRLAEGYFLPPIMFSAREATALLIGGALLARLHATPYAAELESAARKVRASLPDQLSAALDRAARGIGFERIPADLLHPEPAGPPDPPRERAAIDTFVEAMLQRTAVTLRYRSPYRSAADAHVVAPAGLVWDRDRWYLIGRPLDGGAPSFFRADRVTAAGAGAPLPDGALAPDVRALLDRRWLGAAMAVWAADSPVALRLTREQADRLRQDWYYGHAHYDELPDRSVRMTFGEDDPAVVLALLRWLGPGAVLERPRAWRSLLRAELLAMLADAAE